MCHLRAGTKACWLRAPAVAGLTFLKNFSNEEKGRRSGGTQPTNRAAWFERLTVRGTPARGSSAAGHAEGAQLRPRGAAAAGHRGLAHQQRLQDSKCHHRGVCAQPRAAGPVPAGAATRPPGPRPPPVRVRVRSRARGARPARMGFCAYEVTPARPPAGPARRPDSPPRAAHGTVATQGGGGAWRVPLREREPDQDCSPVCCSLLQARAAKPPSRACNVGLTEFAHSPPRAACDPAAGGQSCKVARQRWHLSRRRRAPQRRASPQLPRRHHLAPPPERMQARTAAAGVRLRAARLVT